MTRVNELQKKYPGLPKEVIVKYEVLHHGIADTKDLDKLSYWRPAAQGSYQSYDHDITLKDLKEKTPWRVRDGLVLRPDAFYMRTGTGAPIHRETTSPYTLRETSEDSFALFEGEEKVDVDIFFRPRRKRDEHDKEVLKTSKGTPVADLVARADRACFFIPIVRSCEYFNTGEECLFCNFNPSQEDARSVGLTRSITANLEDTAEAFGILGSEVRLLEGCLESGGILSSETEANVYYRFVEKLAKANPYVPDMKLFGEAMQRKDYQRLRDAGLRCIMMQMEVWDENLFSTIVPGKARHAPRERWIEAFQDAVDVFGRGNVAGKFVAGITLIPENGFKTWQEARDSHIEGNTWCIKHGIMPSWSPLRWAPGSPVSRDPANRQKFPPTEYSLDLAVAHHEAAMEYGLYEWLNPYLYCALHITYPYSAEVGIIRLYGDAGAYMSKFVPYEWNTAAHFLDSIRSPRRTDAKEV